MSIKECLMCENRGTIWANIGYGYQIVQCPECKGKSHEEPDWDSIRTNLEKRIAEKRAVIANA